MKTKLLVRFLNRAARFDGDLELADVLGAAAIAGELSATSGSKLFEGVTPVKHPRLANHKVSKHNRVLVVNHLKATLYSAFIKDLYEDVTGYLTDLIAGAARNGLAPGRLIGEHKLSLDANELLKAGSWPRVVELVAAHLFRRLEEEKSTLKLLESVDKKLGLGVDSKILEDAIPYLELRHLLVHGDGVADADFCKRWPSFGAIPGKRIEIAHKGARAAKDKLSALVTHYDSRAVAAGLIAQADLQP